MDPERREWSGYRVVDIDKILSEILVLSCCKKCQGNLSIVEKSFCGLSSKFDVNCDGCGCIRTFSNSEFIVNNDLGKPVAEVNRRFLYAMRSIGGGHKDLEKFSALMDFPPAITRPTFDKGMKDIHKAVEKVSEDSMLRAVDEEVEATGSNEVTASGDGTWQRRGHTSKNGAVSLIGVKTGKVLDVEVMSTVCRGCSSYTGPRSGEDFEEWWEEHQGDCDVNHEGSAGSMESAGMVTIFRRSEHRAKVKYTSYIGDGDSSTYPSLVNDKPYGADCIPKKVS